MWGEYVPTGLRISAGCRMRFVPLGFVKACYDGSQIMDEYGHCDLSFAELEEQAYRQDCRQRLLRDWWTQNDVLLVCVCDEVSASSALLAVRKTPMSVRYYEAGAQGREAISRHIFFVSDDLGGVVHEVPPRTNCSLVATDELLPIILRGRCVRLRMRPGAFWAGPATG